MCISNEKEERKKKKSTEVKLSTQLNSTTEEKCAGTPVPPCSEAVLMLGVQGLTPCVGAERCVGRDEVSTPTWG